MKDILLCKKEQNEFKFKYFNTFKELSDIIGTLDNAENIEVIYDDVKFRIIAKSLTYKEYK